MSEFPRLTPREREIIELLRQGMRYKEIGRKLGISGGVVSVHVSNLRRKFGACSTIVLMLKLVKVNIC